MWSRKEVKDRSKMAMKNNLLNSIVIVIVHQLLVALTSMAAVSLVLILSSLLFGYVPDNNFDSYSIAFTLTVLILLILSSMISSAFTVGLNSFFIKGIRGEKGRIGDVFSYFTRENIWNIIKTNLLSIFKIAIGYLLFIIPGIVMTYNHFFINHILSENPNMKPKEVLQRSTEIINGNKLDTFILNISFIGWIILSSLTFGIGGLFLSPYMLGSTAALYQKLRYGSYTLAENELKEEKEYLEYFNDN